MVDGDAAGEGGGRLKKVEVVWSTRVKDPCLIKKKCWAQVIDWALGLWTGPGLVWLCLFLDLDY